MNNNIWNISESATLLAECYHKLSSLKNSDDSYGETDNLDHKFILTVNVAQSFMYLGFPLDNPRLANCLGWINRNGRQVENTHVGRMFRLLIHKHFPTVNFDLNGDRDYLSSLIEEKKFTTDIIENQSIFPLMALDILTKRDQENKNLWIILYQFINENINDYIAEPKIASYLAYTCNQHKKYLEKGEQLELVCNLEEKALQTLSDMFNNNLWGSSYLQSSYCLLNLSRISENLLQKYDLNAKSILCNNYMFDFVKGMNFSNIPNNDIPKELVYISDVKEIYSLSILIMGLSHSNFDRNLFQRDFAHAYIKLIYDKLYDPIAKENISLNRIIKYLYPALFFLALISFIIILNFPTIYSTLSIIGAFASILGFVLSIKNKISK